MRQITAEPLTQPAFARFGDVLQADGDFRLINAGLCRRHHDLGRLDFGDARAGLSIFLAQPRALPCQLDLIECHPDGSQAFIPMTQHPFLIVVTAGPQATPRAFLSNGHQGINLLRGTWHGVLTPLADPGLFAVVDRIGATPNLLEHRYGDPWTVTA